jgi:hypothetical protein
MLGVLEDSRDSYQLMSKVTTRASVDREIRRALPLANTE